MYPLISPSFTPSLTTVLQEGKRERDDGMKRREEEEGRGEKCRGEQGEGRRGVKGEEGRRGEEGRMRGRKGRERGEEARGGGEE